MCCENFGSEKPAVDDCPFCGEPVDEDGMTRNACAYEDGRCSNCGGAPCTGAC